MSIVWADLASCRRALVSMVDVFKCCGEKPDGSDCNALATHLACPNAFPDATMLCEDCAKLEKSQRAPWADALRDCVGALRGPRL